MNWLGHVEMYEVFRMYGQISIMSRDLNLLSQLHDLSLSRIFAQFIVWIIYNIYFDS